MYIYAHASIYIYVNSCVYMPACLPLVTACCCSWSKISHATPVWYVRACVTCAIYESIKNLLPTHTHTHSDTHTHRDAQLQRNRYASD